MMTQGEKTNPDEVQRIEALKAQTRPTFLSSAALMSRHGTGQISYCCDSYGVMGKCLHQAAPRRLFGAAKCIVWKFEQYGSLDNRVTCPKCRLYSVTPKKPPPRNLDGAPVLPDAKPEGPPNQRIDPCKL